MISYREDPLDVLDLFAGIGGFSLGLERAGMRTLAFCEIDPYCQRVLTKHWPDVPIFDDVRTLTAQSLANTLGMRQLQSQGGEQDERGRVGDCGIDVICGGFPCQDISLAGKGAGIEGSRSGLWFEYARIIGEVRPRYVIVENVAALLGRGLSRVLGDLAALRYDAEWHCIPASAVGAPHRRDRIWIVAYASGERQRSRRDQSTGNLGGGLVVERAETWGDATHGSEDVADANGEGLSDRRQTGVASSTNETKGRLAFPELERCGGAWWSTEPDVGRVAYGVPARVDRLRCLGNAVVPQIAELIGRAIMEYEMA
jgi:DNA (cytosine-5)-methyltransferase 1